MTRIATFAGLLFCVVAVTVGICMGAASPVADESWPQFRGPDGQGHASTTGLAVTWSETSNVAWKTPIPGKGWSSPVILGDQVWMTTAIDTPETPEQAAVRLKANTGGQPLTLSASVTFRAVCVDRNTGKLLHDVELMTQQQPQWVHRLNSYASPTPVIEPGRLYCHFGTFGTVCVDTAAAKVVWANRDLHIMHENGPGSSPILWNNLVIFHCDGSDKQFVAALDKRTGKLAWRTDRSGKMHSNPQTKKSYGTPIIVPIDGRPQLVSPGSDWLYSYDPATGKELWKVPYEGLGFSIVPRPVIGHGMIYMSTGFEQSQLLAIRYDGSDGNPRPHIAWRYVQQVPKMPSPLLVGKRIYFVNDAGGIVTCLNALTGQDVWRQRIGGSHSASPLYADGRIYLFGRNGVTTVIAPGDEYRELASNKLDGIVMASPAAVDGALFIRTDKALYRIQSRAAE